MSFVFGVLFFFGGATAASTLLTIFWRSKNSIQWTQGRSVCDHCGFRLSSRALLPFVGRFLVLHCTHCKTKSPWYSTIAEFLVGVGWVVVWHQSSPPFDWVWFIFQLTVLTVLIITAIIDFYWQEIPVFLLVGSGVLLIVLNFFAANPSVTTLSWLTGTVVSAGFFGWQYILSRGRWIGAGDIWIGAWLGLLFGWDKIILVLAVGYGLAAVLSMIHVLLGRFKIPRVVPLGGFLCVSGIIFFIINLL